MLAHIHKSVMVAEVLEGLNVRPGGHYLDGTLGMGGHAAAILEASSPTGYLFGCDRDGLAVEEARKRLAGYAGRFELCRGNFADLGELADGREFDGAILDCGFSSPQIDTADRGFSFQLEGRLDMRMDDRDELTAADLVNELDVEELTRIFREFGEEPQAWRFAKAIEHDRRLRPFTTTTQLADLIERLAPRHGRKTHPATRVFQALRMAVNDELGSLNRGLVGIWKLLKPGGRLAVLTFHSLEVRAVRAFGRDREKDYTYPGEVDVPELRQPRKPELRWISRKAVLPGEEELAANARSRSSQLRVMEKI